MRYNRQQYQHFVDELRSSHPVTLRVAEWMDTRPDIRVIEVPEPTWGEYEEDREPYKDGGDIIALESGVRVRTEVKGRSLRWTCKEDFPFSDIIVTSSANWIDCQRARDVPHRFISVAQDWRHIAVVNVPYSLSQWVDKEAYRPDRKVTYMAKYCPIDAVKFMTMEVRR